MFRYWVNDPSFEFVEEPIPVGPVPGGFFELEFSVDAEGLATWSRSGVAKFAAPFTERDRLGILLSSGYGSGVPPMRFAGPML